MKKIQLNEGWKLTYFPQGDYAVEDPGQLRMLNLPEISAVVPGNVELDLMRAGIVPNPLVADHILRLRPFEYYEWWYEKDFEFESSDADPDVELLFHGVDCLATYWINGHKLGESDNMFIEHRFRVKEWIRTGETNRLAVRLRSPLLEAAEQPFDPSPSSYYFHWDSLRIRKAPHSYGWDIMPRAVTAGIWRPVELAVRQGNEIKEIYFHTESVTEQRASVRFFYDLAINIRELSEYELVFKGICGTSEFEVIHKPLFAQGTHPFELEQPRLWWPHGYGEPHLYEVSVQLLKKGEVVAESAVKIGIRTVQLLRTETTDGVNGQFLFRVNGQPIMVKGSNWVPPDIFHSRIAARYEEILQKASELHCNMIRCWGGGVYEDHAFFELCSEYGIMVWQDFAMACASYPQDPAFLERFRKEAKAVVRKLRRHPSLVLWAGDNECDYFFLPVGTEGNRITREILPQVVYQCDPYRPYLQSSPYFSPLIHTDPGAFAWDQGNKEAFLPEDHLWGPRDYYKSRFYKEHKAHFVSEIGYHGCPNESSIRRFIDADHVWPNVNNRQWDIHSTETVFGNHSGRIQLMTNQIAEMFGYVPDSLHDYIVASQISQAEAKKYFIEMTRLKKWKRTGIIWWNLQDGWPQFSDAIVDYYGGKKLAYHYVQRVQQPLCLMIDEPENWHVRVVAGNDSLTDIRGEYRVWDADTNETLLEGVFAAKANENAVLGHIRISHASQRLLLIEWTVDGQTYGNHYLLGTPGFVYQDYRRWLHAIAALPNSFDAEALGR
jgi:beta-mannosidase